VPPAESGVSGQDRGNCRQDLDRNIAVEPRIARAIHLAHAADARRCQDLVWTEFRPSSESAILDLISFKDRSED